jgi:hypothetical protein
MVFLVGSRQVGKTWLSILNFKDRYHIPGIQVVLYLKHEKTEKGIELFSGLDYPKSLIFSSNSAIPPAAA